MARIYPLFSSSKGNATYIGNKDEGILIDIGVSCKKLCDSLRSNDIEPESVKAVFITHTHSDHIKGLTVFGKKYKIPVFAQKTNLEIMAENNILPADCPIYEVDDAYCNVGDFSVVSFETPHDTPASCGYKIHTPDGKTAVICTDLGKVTDSISGILNSADLVLLESNYDEKMLKNGSYPFDLKKRILSDNGHLSNNDCGHQLVNLMSNGVNKFILGHLSQENNTPLIAENSAVKSLSDYERNIDYLLNIAKPDGCGMAVAF